MAAVRKPVQSRNGPVSSSRPDAVGLATAQLQGTSLVRERIYGSNIASRDEPQALRALLTRPAADNLTESGIPPPTVHSCSSELKEKLDRFYELKTQGKHFNDSLMSNKAFRNPHLYTKLVEFVDVDEKSTNFPRNLWDPQDVQQDWYAESIADAQKIKYEQLQAAQAPGKRTRIDFTSGTSSKGKRNDHGRRTQAEGRWVEREQDDRYRPYPQDATRARSSNDRTDTGSSRVFK